MAAWPDRYRNTIIAVLAAALVGAIVYIAIEQRDGPQPLEITSGEAAAENTGPIQVYITGAVEQPGVYELPGDARVVDLLYEAGGPAADANIEAINLAVQLHDEDQVVVPRQGESQPSAGISSQVAGAAAPILNINTASAGELDDLPGIGEVYSQRIVDSRTWDGPYETPDDLVERQIVPRATFERIRELITVGP